jgi:hypothetical protein
MREGRALEYAAATLTTGALLLGVAGMSLTASTDGDIYWHLAAGQEMLRQGRLLAHDPFSISAGGRAWIDVHWLFQLVVAWTHERAGFMALVIGKALLVTSGALLLSRVVRSRAGASALSLFVVCFLAALLTVRELLLLRPTVFTLVFLAAFIYVIERAEERNQSRVLWALPLLQLLWVNVQGLFALGPAVILAYWLGWVVEARWRERSSLPLRAKSAATGSTPVIRSTLLVSGLATLAACLVNPFGVRALGLPGELLRRLVPGGGNVYSENIAENVPPFVLEQQSGQFWHLKWFLLFLALAVVLGRRSLRVSHGLLVGGFLILALIANRNVLLFYWVATPIAVITLFPGALRLLARWSGSRTLGRAAVGGAAASLLLVSASAAAREPSLAQPAPFRVPELSARWIAARGGQSRIFAADHYGGYLIWKLFPDHKPYIDTRLILRSEQQFTEYLRVVDEPRRFDAFAEQHDFDYVVLPTAYPDRYLALLRHLFESPRWKLVLTDGSETLFARAEASSVSAMDLADPRVTARVVDELQQRFRDPRVNAAARVQLATLELLLGEPAQVEAALGSLESVQAQGLRARARLSRGDADGAGRLALGVLQGDPDHVRSLNLLAVIALQRGEPGKAMSFLRRSARADPFDSEMLAILRSLEEQAP